MKYIILIFIIILISLGLYKIISKLIIEFNNLRIKNYKSQLYKAETKNEYYKKLNNNLKNNYRKNFGIEEEKNWKNYWNNYKPEKEKGIIIKLLIFIIKLTWKIIKIILFIFLILLLLTIYQILNTSV